MAQYRLVIECIET